MDHTGEVTRSMVRCADCANRGDKPYKFSALVTCKLEAFNRSVMTRNENARRECKDFKEQK